LIGADQEETQLRFRAHLREPVQTAGLRSAGLPAE